MGLNPRPSFGKVAQFASLDAKAMTEQVTKAQDALAALKALRTARVTPTQQRVSTKTVVRQLSPEAPSKLFDEDEILRGVENGLKFWSDGISQVSEYSESESDFDDFDEELSPRYSFAEVNGDDEEELGEVEEVELNYCEEEEEDDDDPYAAAEQERDEPACLLAVYEDQVDAMDDAPLLPVPVVALDDDPYAALDELDAPASLDQHYGDTQDDYDQPTFLAPPARPETPPKKSLLLGLDSPSFLKTDDLSPSFLKTDDDGLTTYVLRDPWATDYESPDDFDEPGLLGLACF